MVDFNANNTVSTPALDVVKILWLQARNNLFEAYEYYRKHSETGTDVGLGVVHARLITWFLEIQASLIRRLPAGEYNKIKDEVFGSPGEPRILELVYLFNQEMDKLNLIKIDTRRTYDSSRVEVENREKGL